MDVVRRTAVSSESGPNRRPQVYLRRPTDFASLTMPLGHHFLPKTESFTGIKQKSSASARLTPTLPRDIGGLVPGRPPAAL